MKQKALEFAAPPGQDVWVKVTEVSPDMGSGGFRVHGSMRAVEQDSGQDQDPNGALAAAGRGGGGCGLGAGAVMLACCWGRGCWRAWLS
jgi:hypothetical protein